MKTNAVKSPDSQHQTPSSKQVAVLVFIAACLLISIAFILSFLRGEAVQDTLAHMHKETAAVIEVATQAAPKETPRATPEPSIAATPSFTQTPESAPTPKAEPIETESVPDTEVPSPTPTPAPNGETHALSKYAREWGYLVSKNHATPWISDLAKEYASKYDAYYVYNTDEMVIYLTFDAGYENGCTEKILDVLKAHDAKATFFICGGYAHKNPDILKRMVDEGHLVGNHTVKHIPFHKLTDEEIASELKGVEEAYKRVIGQDMPKFMRPPEGSYSEYSLKVTQDLGYKTIMWSMSLPNDWNLKKQPSREVALSMARDQHHKGAIPLLHAVSPTVADTLDEMLTVWENEGYRFGLLTEIE